jgi:hypothetical protein
MQQMPQIWMTYKELGGLLGCGSDEARRRVQDEGLDRKMSRDGQTRIKLSRPWVGLFIKRLKNDDPIDWTILDLPVHEAMVEDSPKSGTAQIAEFLPRQQLHEHDDHRVPRRCFNGRC